MSELARMLEDETLDLDERRKICLLAWLQDNGNEYHLDDIEEAYGNVFAVNPHSVKDGTSPAKAKELVELVRRALQIVVDALYVGDSDALTFEKQVSAKIFVNRNADESESSEDGARMLSRDVSTWTVKDLADAQKLADRRDSWGDFSPQPDKDLIPTYSTLTALCRELCPELVEIGLHDLVNSLYFLCPATDGQTHAKDHRDTLREAFDRREIQDRRKTRHTNDGEYLVVTDEEADELWEADLDNYLDEGCVVGAESPYFDRNAWKRDARIDGRAHSLGRYDGSEGVYEEFFIYRQN